MFDDYVEHAGTADAAGGLRGVPQLLDQGFEPDADHDPHRNQHEQEELLNGLEAGYHPSISAAADADPLFILGRVQFDIHIPANLVAFAIASDLLYMGLTNNQIVHINLRKPELTQWIQAKVPIYKLFLDPSGRHLLITSQSGETYYLYAGWSQRQPKLLQSIKLVIESVAWNRTFLLSTAASKAGASSTRELLLGGRNGTIYEAVLEGKDEMFKNHDRVYRPLFTLPERQPIAGIQFEWFPVSDPKRGLVIVATTTRLYQFAGPPNKQMDDGVRSFASIFNAYKDTTPKFLELTGENKHSQLHVVVGRGEHPAAQARSVAWLTGQGIYNGSLNLTEVSSNDSLIDSAQLVPYPLTASTRATSPTTPHLPKDTEIPVSIGIADFHHLSVFQGRVAAVCTLDQRLAYEEAIPLKPAESVLGLVSDAVNATHWIYTDSSLFELKVNNETRDLWHFYMTQGDYEKAMKYASNPVHRDLVNASQADTFFSNGHYIQAAQKYALTTRSFEEVTLRFVDAGERDALRYYLVARLLRTRKTDLTQRMVLATWLVEFFLAKANDLDDLIASESASHDVEDLKAERTLLENDLKDFFETYKANLDRQTVYDLILSHGRADVFLHYATTIGDFEKVMEHHVLEEEWDRAIDVLNKQSDLPLYYRFSTVLMRNAPKATVDAWIRQPALDPLLLVPALLQLQHTPRDPLSPNHATRYLNHVIFEQHNTSPTIHNLLITLLASPTSSDDDGPLLRFLTSCPADPITNKPYYDLDYALRTCKTNGRIQACVHIYAKMGLWEQSVELALQKGDVELAMINADKPEEDPALRKKLWLLIAKYVVQDKKDIKSAMRFLESTNLLKIEDILPFFPDFVVIDDFKEEICTALEGYTAHIEELKTEMDEATKSAESIKKDIADLKNRFVTVGADERCSSCSYPLFTRQFYVFPCQHTFHADCLIGMVKEYLPAHALRRILLLQAELVQASGVNNPIAPPGQPQPIPRQRTLLSAQFGQQANGRPNLLYSTALLTNPLLLAAPLAPAAIGRNVFAAANQLKDLIIPDALANAIALPFQPWTGGSSAQSKKNEKGERRTAEKIREELDELLASSCPLCESVVVGLDKLFVGEDEVDSWQL